MSSGANAPRARELHPALRIALFLILLFLFLVSIKLMGSSIKALGQDTATGLFVGASNPFAGLAIGILATVLVQSSSVTTATIVAMVGARSIPVEVAVPMIMGANIGTSITNTIVALGHARQSKEFELAFAGATMHDIFNVMAVSVFLPLEILSSGSFGAHTGGLLTEAAVRVAFLFDPAIDLSGEAVEAVVKSDSWRSPIKVAVGWLSGLVESALITDAENPTPTELVLMFVLSLGGIFATLVYITKNMKRLMANRAESFLNRALEKSGLIGIMVGALMTVAVQSSSITTSLLIPLIAAGILPLRNALPVTLGANIGTTVTAMLAALVTGSWGLVIALVHLIFNLAATALIYPIPALRYLPVRLAAGLARLTIRNRLWAVAYVGITFVVAPLVGMLIFKD